MGDYEHKVLIRSRPRRRFAQSLVAPGEAQRSGFAGKRRSKGTSAVFAARRKRSRVDFATTSRHGQSNSPPAGGEIPLRKEPSSGPMRASGPTKKRSIIAPSSVTVSPCHLPPKGKAFKGSPLIRLAFGQPPSPQGEGFAGEAPSSAPFGGTFPPGGRLCGGGPRGTFPRWEGLKNETGAPGRPFSRGRLIALIGDTSCWSDTGARR